LGLKTHPQIFSFGIERYVRKYIEYEPINVQANWMPEIPFLNLRVELIYNSNLICIKEYSAEIINEFPAMISFDTLSTDQSISEIRFEVESPNVFLFNDSTDTQ